MLVEIQVKHALSCQVVRVALDHFYDNGDGSLTFVSNNSTWPSRERFDVKPCRGYTLEMTPINKSCISPASVSVFIQTVPGDSFIQVIDVSLEFTEKKTRSVAIFYFKTILALSKK